MQDASDMELVRKFVRQSSEEAFSELVRRHINLVYSVALRFTGNSEDAQDVAQAVFIIFAKKSPSLLDRSVLTGWLYEATRFAATGVLRRRVRRQTHEQEAYMQSTLNENDSEGVWQQLVPHLEGAMSRLGEGDRTLLALRFYENKSGAEAAALLGIREDAAHKRTARALEKLRRFFGQRGIAVSAAAIAGAVSANSLQAAPIGLANTISAVAIVKGAAAGSSTLTLIKTTLKIMAWTKAKTGIAIGAAAILAVGITTGIIVHKSNDSVSSKSLFASKRELSDSDIANLEKATGARPEQVAETFFRACSQGDWTEAANYWQVDPRNKDAVPSFPDSFKERYGGLTILSAGKPFKGRISVAKLIELQPQLRNQFKGGEKDFEAAGVFVPYKMRLRDGTIREWQLSIRCDNPDHRTTMAGCDWAQKHMFFAKTPISRL